MSSARLSVYLFRRLTAAATCGWFTAERRRGQIDSCGRLVYTRCQSIIIIVHRLTCHVSVMRMMNRRRGGHVDLRVAVSVIKRFEFLSESACGDFQVGSNDVR